MADWRLTGLAAAAVLGSVANAGAAITLTGDSSVPEMSVVAAGGQMQLSFSAAGMAAGQSLNLQLSFVNERGQVIENRTVPVTADASGKWQGSITAPAGQMGYYRANAQLSNGVTLPAAGSRGAGYLTYAVVPDPAQRVDYGEAKSRFGLQGGFGRTWGNAALQFLGARWSLDSGFDWKNNEPDYAGQWDGNAGAPPSGEWKTYRVPTLFMAPAWAVIPSTYKYNTGALTPAGEVAWESYVKKAAQAFAAKYPDRAKNIYQITWEPIKNWGFSGTDEQLLKIYQIACQAIHAVDPKAVVAGPTMGIHDEGAYPGHYERETQSVALFQKGLANYIDAYTAHPYYAAAQNAGSPEAEKMVDRVRYLKGIVAQFGNDAGKTIPMYGTEQGMADDGTLAGELRVARTLIRQNLITLGEGFGFNIGFFAVDYSMNAGASIDRYGYFHNLENGIPWGPAKASPKPIVPAYAAQSLLIDGHESAGALETMGGTKWGYRFKREEDSRMVQALWDYGATSSTYSLYTGLDRVLTYDWMGNSQWMTTNDGTLTLTLGQEPVYLVTPPAWNVNGNARWGDAVNWTTLVPDSAGAEAHFTGKITGGRTITVDAPATIGSMYFRNSSGYEIEGTGGLTLDTKGANAVIGVAGGNHVISTPLTLKRDLDVLVRGSDDTMEITGSLQQAAGKVITKRGDGRLGLPSGITVGGLRVEAGQMGFLAGGTRAIDTGSLLLVDGARLDLADNDMVVRGGDLAAISARLGSAFAGRWIGNGIGSQAAHDDPRFLSALGVLLNNNGSGQPMYSTFSGVAGLNADDVLVGYTVYGDADLNGVVELLDYARMGGVHWSGGDFNYDGAVTAVDYALIDFVAKSQGATFFAAMYAAHAGSYESAYTDVFAALEAGTYFTQGVPEPTGVASGLALGCAGLLRRTRRRS